MKLRHVGLTVAKRAQQHTGVLTQLGWAQAQPQTFAIQRDRQQRHPHGLRGRPVEEEVPSRTRGEKLRLIFPQMQAQFFFCLPVGAWAAVEEGFRWSNRSGLPDAPGRVPPPC